MSTPNEDRKQGVEDELNAPLDAIAHVGIDKPHEMLDEAVKAKVISEEVKDKIQTEMPGHVLLFQKNLAVEQRETVNNKVSVRRAFQLTYGKFMLEADNELKKTDSVLMRALEKVVKFPVNRKLGLKGRTELEAAAAQLDKVRYSRDAGEYANNQYRDSSAEREDMEEKKAKTEDDIKNLEQLQDSFEDIDVAENLDQRIKVLADIHDLRKGFKERKTELIKESSELDGQNGELQEKIDNYKGLVNTLTDNLNHLSVAVSRHVNDDEATVIEAVLALLHEIDTGDDFDIKAFQDFLESELKPLLERIYPSYIRGFAGIASPALPTGYANEQIQRPLKAITAQLKTLKGDVYLFHDQEDIGIVGEERDRISGLSEDAEESFSKEVDLLHYDLDKFDDVVRIFRKGVDDNNQLSPELVQSISTRCGKYLKEYEGFQWEPTESLDLKHFQDFVENVYEAFMDDILELLEPELITKDNEFASIDDSLAILNSQIDVYQSYSESGLHANLAATIQNDLEGAHDELAQLQIYLSDLEAKRIPLDEERETQVEEKGRIDHNLDTIGKQIVELDVDWQKLSKQLKTAQQIVEDDEDQNAMYLAKQSINEINQKLSEMELRLAELKEKHKKAYWKNQREGTAVVDKIKDIEDEAESTQRAISKLQAKINTLHSMTPENRLIENAFSGLRFDSDGNMKVRGFETNFEHAVGQLQEAIDYFSSPTNIPELRKAHDELSQAVNDSREALIKGLELDSDFLTLDIKTKIKKLEREIKAKDSAHSKLTTFFKEQNIKKDLDALERNHFKRYPKGQTAPAFDRAGEQTRLEDEYSNNARKLSKDLDMLEELKDKYSRIDEATNAFYSSSETLFKHLEALEKANVPISSNGKQLQIEVALAQFGDIDERKIDPHKLLRLHSSFQGFFDADSNVVDLVRDVREAHADISESTDLTDTEAAKKIVHAIVAEQYPDLPFEEQQKVASAILADDIHTIQTEQSYEELAEEHFAEIADTVNMVGVQGRLVNFKFAVDDKEQQPFKGLTPEDFSSWDRMEELFDLGKLNYQNGFFALAAFEMFAEEGDGKRSKQSVELKKKLRMSLAEELGIEERLDGAGENRILDDAFKEQTEKAKPLMQEYFKEYSVKNLEWKQYKVNELQMRFQLYNEQLKLGKIDQTVYKLKCDQVYEEARAYDVADRFTQSSVLAGFWNSKHSQWTRDKGLEVGSYTARKAKAGLFEGGMLYLRGLVGGVKLAATTTAQTVLKAPVSILKNGGLLAISPLKWGVNLKRRTQNLINGGRNWFRKRKGKELKEKVEMWTPFSVGESVRKDLGRVGEYSKTKASKTWEGTKTAFGKVGGFWSKEAWKSNAYKDRTDVDTASLEKQADELAKAGQGESIQVESSPYIDLDKYRVQLQELDKMTGVPDAKAA